MRGAVALSCLIALAGCGGGGGGGSGGSTGGSSGGSPSSQVPPLAAPSELADIIYNGSSAAHAVNDAQAGLIVDSALSAIQLLLKETSDFNPADVAVDSRGIVQRVVAGGDGHVELTGRLQPNGLGWVQFEYVRYAGNGVLVNGRSVREITVGPAGYSRRTRYTSDDLKIVNGYGVTYTYNSNLYVDEVDGAATRRISGNYVVGIDPIGLPEVQTMIEVAHLDIDLTSDGLHSFDVQARVYDSLLGFMDVSTNSPLLFADAKATLPVAGGALHMRGSGNAAVEMQPLNAANVAVAIDATGTGVFDRSVRLSSAQSFASQINTQGSGLPSAVLGANRLVADNDDVPRLEGRYSTHADGKLLTYSWRTVMAPPGAVVTIPNPNLPRPAATFSVPGDYRFELTVSDGTNTSRDQVDLVIGDQAGTTLATDIAALAPPDQHLAVGEGFDLDAAPSAFARPGTLSYDVSASNEAGQLQTVAMTGTVGHFVPTSAGVYRMDVRVTNDSPTEESTDSLWLYVDRDPLFSVPWTHQAKDSGALSALLTADVSGDDRADLIEVSAPPAGTASPFTQNLAIFRGMPGAAPIGPRTLLSSTAGREVAAGDLNGDGRRDLVIASAAGVTVFYQQADGSLGAPVSYGNGSGCAATSNVDLLGLSIGDVNDDGRDDVVRMRSCGDAIEAFLQQPDGTLSGPTVLVPGSGMHRPRALADFTGDGRVDLVLDASDGNFTLYRQLAGGGFAAGVAVDVGGSNGGNVVPALCDGDVNSDGRRDLVAVAAQRVAVLTQSPGGELSAPAFIAMPASANGGLPGECLVRDLSGDGRADVFVQPFGTMPFVLLQDAHGALAAPVVDPRARATILGARTLGAADIDHDGVIDLVYGDAHGIVVQTHL